MKKGFVSLLIIFSLLLSFCFLTNVKAYEENAFTDGKCVTNDGWKSMAHINYSLDDEKGIYVVSDKTYEEYMSTNDGSENVFYLASTDGKVLYGIVPNYDASMKDSTIKSDVFDKGIVTTASCKDAYVASKTVIGNPPSDSSYINFDNLPNNGGSSQPTNPTNNEKPNNNNNNSNTSSGNNLDEDSSLQKLSSPNTASPAAFSIILVSLILIIFAVYCLYKNVTKQKE